MVTYKVFALKSEIENVAPVVWVVLYLLNFIESGLLLLLFYFFYYW